MAEASSWAVVIPVVHWADTEEAKITEPEAFHEILPPAICPLPSLFSFHFVPFVIEPSEPNEMLFFQMWLWSNAHPAMRL